MDWEYFHYRKVSNMMFLQIFWIVLQHEGDWIVYVNCIGVFQNQLCLTLLGRVDYVTPLVFYSSYACRRQENGEDRSKKNKQLGICVVKFVPLADLQLWLCYHVHCWVLARQGCGWHWDQILAPLGVNQWSQSARSSFGHQIGALKKIRTSPNARVMIFVTKPPIHIHICYQLNGWWL